MPIRLNSFGASPAPTHAKMVAKSDSDRTADLLDAVAEEAKTRRIDIDSAETLDRIARGWLASGGKPVLVDKADLGCLPDVSAVERRTTPHGLPAGYVPALTLRNRLAAEPAPAPTLMVKSDVAARMGLHPSANVGRGAVTPSKPATPPSPCVKADAAPAAAPQITTLGNAFAAALERFGKTADELCNRVQNQAQKSATPPVTQAAPVTVATARPKVRMATATPVQKSDEAAPRLVCKGSTLPNDFGPGVRNARVIVR